MTDDANSGCSKFVLYAHQPYDWMLAIVEAPTKDKAKEAVDHYDEIAYVIPFDEWCERVRDGFDVPHIVDLENPDGIGWLR